MSASDPAPDLTIIVPTFNRADLLADVLADLDRQVARPGTYEVVVVDDGSTDSTQDALAAFRPSNYALHAVRQPNGGLNKARNTGADAAKGELLAFLDDDVLLSPQYVNEMLGAFRAHPDAAAVAGQVTLKFEADPPPWLTPMLEEYLSVFNANARSEYLDPPDYPRGANFGLRRSDWSDLGGFRTGLDRHGTSLVSNGELEFFARLHRAGGRMVSCSGAEVFHRVPAERLTLSWFRRRAEAQGRSDVLVERIDQGQHRRSSRIREVLRAARAMPILVKSLVARRGRASAVVWISYCQGRAAAIRAPGGD